MTNYFQGPYCSGNGMATMVYQNAVNYGLPFYDTFAGNNTMFLQPMNASSLGWKTSMPYDQWQQKLNSNYNYSFGQPGMIFVQQPTGMVFGQQPTTTTTTPSSKQASLVYVSTPNGGYMKDTNTKTPSLFCEQSLSYDTSKIDSPFSSVYTSPGYFGSPHHQGAVFFMTKTNDLGVGVL
jgi:hypothetical protein